AVIAAGVVALACVAIPLPMTAKPQDTATVTLRTVHPVPDETVLATVQLHPADAAEDAEWFTITSWQGAGPGDGGLVIANMLPMGAGSYRADRPVPVSGDWKTLLRLQKGTA